MATLYQSTKNQTQLSEQASVVVHAHVYQTNGAVSNVSEQTSTLVHHHYYISIKRNARLYDKPDYKITTHWRIWGYGDDGTFGDTYLANWLPACQSFLPLFLEQDWPEAQSKEDVELFLIPGELVGSTSAFSEIDTVTPYQVKLTDCNFIPNDYIVDLENQFYINIGVIVVDKEFKFEFTNWTSKTLVINQVRVPGQSGIEIIGGDLNGATIPIGSTFEIRGIAKINDGIDYVNDFIIVETMTGEKLRFDFIIIRVNDSIIALEPLRNSYSENYTIYSKTFKTITGIETVKTLNSEPKVSRVTGNYPAVSTEETAKTGTILKFGHSNVAYQVLWFWSMPHDAQESYTELNISVDDYPVFNKAEYIYIFDRTSRQGVIVKPASFDDGKITLLTETAMPFDIVNAEVYIIPIIKALLQKNNTTTYNMFPSATFNIQTKEY